MLIKKIWKNISRLALNKDKKKILEEYNLLSPLLDKASEYTIRNGEKIDIENYLDHIILEEAFKFSNDDFEFSVNNQTINYGTLFLNHVENYRDVQAKIGNNEALKARKLIKIKEKDGKIREARGGWDFEYLSEAYKDKIKENLRILESKYNEQEMLKNLVVR